MRTLKLIVEYDGTGFHGFQIQTADGKPSRTVQGALAAALLQMTGESVTVYGASRTDAGVHARGQVVSFDLQASAIALRGFQRGLTTLIGDDFAVRSAEEVEPGWRPRTDVRGKRYRYTFWNDATPSALDRRRSWFVRDKMDLSRLEEAAQVLVGTHDFEAFRAAGCSAKHAVRTIYEIRVIPGDYARLHVDVIGNAFVRNMVRIICGNLKAVATGQMSTGQLVEVLAGRDRSKGGVTAPAHGLCLEEVIYDSRLPKKPKSDVDVRV